jgi:dTDP-glucose 4,6-dehydratase
MRKRLPKILVTGGAGFIGSAFVRRLIKGTVPAGSKGTVPTGSKGTVPVPPGYFVAGGRGLSLNSKIVVIDNLTYAGDLKRLEEVKSGYKFYQADICDRNKIEGILRKERPEVVVNFAAATHVDRSILDATSFLQTNILGTQVLLDAARKNKVKRFIQISSDEVYGDIRKGKFTESSPLKPSSPYAASKAAADLLVKSYIRTYGFPAIIVRPCNNYGPWQYPEKLIPLAVLKILKRQKIPVYAEGRNVREWLYVEDCAAGILEVLKNGRIGEIYNLGSGQEKQNIAVVRTLLGLLHASSDKIEFIKDRPGHDIRYSLNSQKIKNKIGWRPKTKFADGLALTVSWCRKHESWLAGKWKNIALLYSGR